MTVSYQYKVASSTSGGFTRLLFMWRGSLFKLIYRELLIFIIAFDILSLLYRNLLTNDQKEIFEKVVTYCDTFIELIPLTFILGFYVAYVAARWWQQYQAIPWPDKCMHTIALYIPGKDEHIRVVRRTLMRYLNLTLVLILRSISSAVKKRFPTLDHLTEVGFMTQTEKQMFLAIPNCDFNTYWIPCAWFVHVLKDTKAENPNIDPFGVKLIMEEFNEFRAKCGLLWSYDWISIPLVYTQVVTLATYSFFLVAVVGRQYVEHSPKKMQMRIDVYLPIFTILQFFFFMGLLKVAEQLINPFGDDDEDFELNWLIDRHTKVSYLGVDTLMLQCPPLTKDKFFDNADLVLPYTGASVVHKKKTYRGSVHFLTIPENQQDLYLPEIEEECDEEETPPKPRRGSIFTNPFSHKTSTDQNMNDKEDSRRYSIDGFGNGRYKRSSLSPSSNRKRADISLNHISIISSKDSDFETSPRRPVTKHNSMMYTPDIRKQKGNNVKEKRRKSVPTLMRRKDSIMLRSDVKWSSRRKSVDTQWKGIRWKPFLKEGEPLEALNVSSLKSQSQSQTPRSEFMYMNRAYTSSPSESRDVNTALKEDIATENHEHDVKDGTNQNCDNSFRIGTPVPIDKDIVLNLPLNDSLV